MYYVGEKKKNEMGLSRQSVYVPTQSYSLQSRCRRPSRPRWPARLPHQPWEKYDHRGWRLLGWIELSVFIRKRSGSICLCPREISNLYLLRLLAEAAGGCWKDGLANASLEAGWMRPLSSNRPFAKMLLLLHSKVSNVGSDTFGNPIFQKVLQN